MSHDRGAVWWGPAPHKSSPAYRPWLIVSDESHPFARTECIGLALTTQHHSEGIEIPADGWVAGGSRKTAFISPWYVATLKYRDLDRKQGTLADGIVADAIDELHRYTSSEA